eukprot:scaffold84763_cov31-Tisochrysis_lutea.AAC.3
MVHAACAAISSSASFCATRTVLPFTQSWLRTASALSFAVTYTRRTSGAKVATPLTTRWAREERPTSGDSVSGPKMSID